MGKARRTFGSNHSAVEYHAEKETTWKTYTYIDHIIIYLR